MKTLLVYVVLAWLFIPEAKAGAQPDIYSANCWEIAGKSGKITWVEIHDAEEAQRSGVAHVSVHARRKAAPVWELEWVCDHIAITTEALKRSVTRPLKIRGAYPERFSAAYARWKLDEAKGTAGICSTSIQEFMAKGHPSR